MKTKITEMIKITVAAFTVLATVFGTGCSINIGGGEAIKGSETKKAEAENTEGKEAEGKEAEGKEQETEETETSGDITSVSVDDTSMYDAYIRAVEASLAEYDVNKDELAFELVHIDGDDIPELVISKPGYYIDVYTYYDGNLSHIIDYWAYGAGGNYGYDYIPYKNVICNENSDMAGALKWINLYKISDDHNELESILDQSLTARYYDSDELYPDDLENVQMLDRPVYYYGDKKITEEEFHSYKPNEDYYSLGKGVDYDTFMQCMNNKTLPDYSKFPYFFINECDCTWGQAVTYSQMNGGTLMCIDTEEKWDAVTSYIREYYFYMSDVIYVGASVGPDGDYEWRSGEKIDPDLWLPGEPSKISATPEGDLVDETCVVLIYDSGTDQFYLNDVPNDLPAMAPYYQGQIGYLCELEFE